MERENFVIKIISVFAVFLFFTNCINAKYPDQTKPNIDESQIIEELTWSILKYDHVIESRNYGSASTPRPMVGLLVVLSNMMSKRVCQIALSVYDEDRMEMLKNLKDFCMKNMKIFMIEYYQALIKITLSQYYSSCKATADEMVLLGDKLLIDHYHGFCYSQACVNTAVLRLCGIPSEEVFNVIIPSHAFTVVKIEDKWYAFDSAKGQHNEGNQYIFELKELKYDYFSTLENDRYFINFETHEEEIVPSMLSNYSNMQVSLLIDTITGIQTLLNNSNLGSENCDIDEFVNNSTPYPYFKNVSVPYTIFDAVGNNFEEKANYLANIIQEFVENQTDETNPNQYDRSLYCFGVFPSNYPQAYANAAKYGVINSNHAKVFDSKNPTLDIILTNLWVNLRIKTKKISDENHIYNTELICRIKKGSTIDKALVAYGTLRNMKKDNEFWSPDDLFVIISENNQGYLAVNHTTKGWMYLEFSKGFLVKKNVENISFAFNEEVKLSEWDK